MPVVRPESIVYLIVRGAHKGRKCVVVPRNRTSLSVHVIFIGDNAKDSAFINPGDLVQLETPGWPRGIIGRTYGLREYLERQHGNGTNMLHTELFAQPRALKPDDVLATNEAITEPIRWGHNSSILVRLEKTGWVELAPRLPIALKGNERFKLPMDLLEGEKLITGCCIAMESLSLGVRRVGWVNVYLDQKDCIIETPSCVPLALA